MLDCPFCRRVAALYERPDADIVWQFPHSVAFIGSWQFYNGYCLLASRKHAAELSGLDESERRAYLEEMCLLARAIELGLRPHKLNYELLGNQVPHLHWHLFPRYAEQADRLKPVWLALEAAERDPAIRQQLETGLHGRAALITILQKQLHQLNAPTA